MRLFRRLLLREFVPMALLAIFFFALMIVMADLFANLWRYLNQDVPVNRVLYVSLLYVPRSVSWALPVGSLFAAAYALGVLGSRNELIAVFGTGVSLHRFVLPLLLVAAVLGVGGFFLEDRLAIPLVKRRKAISSELLSLSDSGSNARVTAIASGGLVVYHADYYDDERQTLTGLTVVEINEESRFVRRIDAAKAVWTDDGDWLLEGCRIFVPDENGDVVQLYRERYVDPEVNEPPSTFRRESREIDEMDTKEAASWIVSQRKAGLPYRGLQSEFYGRFTMALTPFLVVLFAGALGGRFRRNVLLMSLLTSLVLAVGWYVSRMITTLLARIGLMPPLAGAVLPFVLFLSLGFFLFRKART
jgi:lipopolysaccharide export system permease protein